MNGNPRIPPGNDIDRLLRGFGARMPCSPTPDVVVAVVQHMDEPSGVAQTQWPCRSLSERGDELFPTMNRSEQWSTESPRAEIGPPQRSFRHCRTQALKYAATIIVFGAVTALLALVFRGSGDDDRPAVASITESSIVTQERLYVVSLVDTSEDDNSIRYSSHVTAYDAQTGDEIYAINTGSQVDAVLSPDGSRLFVSAIGNGGDDLIAVDAATGQELWRTAIQDRLHWIMSLGPSALAVSPDNQRLYVYRVDAKIQVIDASTGESITVIGPTINCPAKLHVSPDGRTLYLVCHERPGTMVIDLATGEPITGIGLSRGAASGTALSPDGRILYIVGAGQATVVDMDARTVMDVVPLELDTYPARLLRLVALSPAGTRLFVGLGTDRDPETSAVSSREIAVFDTSTWQEVGRITTELPITGQTLAGAPGNQAVFAVHNAFRENTSIPTTASILKLSPDADPSIFANREREEVLAVISGQVEVPEMSEPTPAPTTMVTVPTLDDSSFVIPMTFEGGWRRIEMTAIAQSTDGGDVVVEVEANGPEGPENQVNLMWYVAAGSCHIFRDEQLQYLYPPEVLLRTNPVSSGSDYQAVTLVLEREWLAQPLVVGAFQQGGGPLVACGDVPPQETTPVPIGTESGSEIGARAVGWMTQNRDVLVQVEADGPESQLDLIWYVAVGSCSIEGEDYPSEVLHETSPDNPGPRAVTLVLDRDWLSQPLMVGAVRAGDDSPVACGDVPAITNPEGTPSAEPTPLGEQNWSPYR